MPQLQRKVNPTLNQTAMTQRIAKKINAAAERMGSMPAIGTQVVLRCGGVVCQEGTKRCVETGLVGIDLPKLGGEHLPARLAGLWMN